MDTLKRTREFDPFDATQDASPHCTHKAKVQEKDKKNIAEEEIKNDEESTSGKTLKEDEKDQQDTEDETDEGNSTNTECDQDSDVSFLSDTDEDIDTAEIEEEWFEYMKETQEIQKTR